MHEMPGLLLVVLKRTYKGPLLHETYLSYQRQVWCRAYLSFFIFLVWCNAYSIWDAEGQMTTTHWGNRGKKETFAM